MYIDLIKLKPNKKEIFSFPVALWDFLWSVGKSFLPKVQESHNSFWVGGFWHESIELLETTILFVYKIVYMYIIKLKPNKKEIFSFPVASWDFLWSVGKKNYQKSKSPIILFGSGGFWHESIELLETTILLFNRSQWLDMTRIFSFPVALWGRSGKNFQKSQILFGSGVFDMSRSSYWKRQYFLFNRPQWLDMH